MSCVTYCNDLVSSDPYIFVPTGLKINFVIDTLRTVLSGSIAMSGTLVSTMSEKRLRMRLADLQNQTSRRHGNAGLDGSSCCPIKGAKLMWLVISYYYVYFYSFYTVWEGSKSMKIFFFFCLSFKEQRLVLQEEHEWLESYAHFRTWVTAKP